MAFKPARALLAVLVLGLALSSAVAKGADPNRPSGYSAPSLETSQEAREVRAGDRAAIRAVIEAQIAAFRRDDGEAAFAHASPGIRGRFGSPESFMAMVRSAYGAIHRPAYLAFRDVRLVAGRLAQLIDVVGPDGRTVVAVYFMAQLTHGGWRIGDVYLIDPPPGA